MESTLRFASAVASQDGRNRGDLTLASLKPHYACLRIAHPLRPPRIKPVCGQLIRHDHRFVVDIRGV